MWRSHYGEWGSNFCASGTPFGHGYGMFGWFFTILFWGLIAYLAIRVIRHLFGGRKAAENDSAFAILRNRFAAGEISEEEYLVRKATLAQR